MGDGIIDGGTITVTGQGNAAALNDFPTISDFSDPGDPNGGASATNPSTNWLGTAVQWVSQTADEVSNATGAIMDAQQSVQNAYRQANPQPVPLKKAPDRMSTQQSQGIGLVLLLGAGAFLLLHGS